MWSTESLRKSQSTALMPKLRHQATRAAGKSLQCLVCFRAASVKTDGALAAPVAIALIATEVGATAAAAQQ